MDKLLEIKNLTLSDASGSSILDNIDLEINKGEIIGLMGPSGAGKTLLGLSICGLLPGNLRGHLKGQIGLYLPDLPRLELLDADQKLWSKLQGNRISLLFQEAGLALNPIKRCGRQILDVLEAVNKVATKRKALDLLFSTGLDSPERIYHSFPYQLSGGQKQRILIAMVMAIAPDLLIVDEPTASLDQPARKEVLALLAGLSKKTGMGMLLISHDEQAIRAYSDRIIRISEGKITSSSPGSTIPVKRDDIQQGKTKKGDNRISEEESEASLTLRGVNFYYNSASIWQKESSFHALDGIDLDIWPGEMLAITGLSGSGKSTLAKILVRIIEPSAGTMTLGSKNYEQIPLQVWRRYVQLVFQDPANTLDPLMTVGAQIKEVIRKHKAYADLDKGLAELISVLHLSPKLMDHYPHELSGGQKQRVAIARALSVKPEILVLDEAVSALDQSIQYKILDILTEMKQNSKIPLVFITHDINLASRYADRMLVLKNGKVVEYGKTAEILREPTHPHTQDLLSGHIKV